VYSPEPTFKNIIVSLSTGDDISCLVTGDGVIAAAGCCMFNNGIF
jgi:hypothetical protein